MGITDAQGNLLAQYVYDPWGKLLQINTTEPDNADQLAVATANPLRYRGYYYDSETGMYYLQSRYYDPDLGRFISADDFDCLTTSNFFSVNAYAYCWNSPIAFKDSEGNTPNLALAYANIKAFLVDVNGKIAEKLEAKKQKFLEKLQERVENLKAKFDEAKEKAKYYLKNPDVFASKIASRIAGHEVTVRFPIIELLRAVQKKKEENAQKQQNNASESQIALLVAKDETTDNWFEAVLKALCIAIEVDTITRIFEAIFKSVNPNFNWNDWYDSLSEFNKKLINDFSLFGAAFLNHLYVDVLEMKDFKNVSNALSDFFSQKNFEKITELVIDKLTYSERGAGYVAIWMSFTDAFNGYNDGTYTGFQSVMLMGFDLITMVMAASGSGAFAVIMPIIAREVVLFGIKFDNGHYWG